MKQTFLLFVFSVSALLGTGCKDKSAETAPGTSSTSTPDQPAAMDQIAEAAGKAADEVVSEVKKQSAEAVAEVQKQAKAAYDDLSKQLIESTKGKTDALLKDLSTDLQGRSQKLAEALKNNETLTAQLQSAVAALLGNQDSQAVGDMGGIAAAKLTPEQTTLAKDFYNVGAAFVTQRNFSSLAGSESDVASLVNSVRQGNYTQALVPLQKIYGQATLTPAQKDLLGKTFDQYMPEGWKDTAGSLQKGIDALKGFGQ